jgi:hypothetical protein
LAPSLVYIGLQKSCVWSISLEIPHSVNEVGIAATHKRRPATTAV